MDFQEMWGKALKHTEVIRSRVQGLMTHQDTPVPYILLSESSINLGDTVVRKGEVLVEKPSLILPPNIPQFEGFDFDQESQMKEDNFVNFLLVRGINIPSFRYNNKTHSLDIYEGEVGRAIEFYQDQLQRMENVHTGLLTGPEDCWPFSLLIYSCMQIAKNVDVDIKRLLDDYKKRK